MQRASKIKAVVRYIISRTGIPMISWDGTGNRIDAPPPYEIVVSTDGVGWRFFQYVRDMPRDRIGVVVRYDKHIEHIDEAVVGMSLATFAILLSSHYSDVKDRITTYSEETNGTSSNQRRVRGHRP